MQHNAEYVSAWYGVEGQDDPPCDVYWDSFKDCWLDGYETGYKAALEALRIDGQEAGDA